VRRHNVRSFLQNVDDLSVWLSIPPCPRICRDLRPSSLSSAPLYIIPGYVVL